MRAAQPRRRRRPGPVAHCAPSGRRRRTVPSPATGQSPSTIAARPPSDSLSAATAERAAPKLSAATASAAAPSTAAIAGLVARPHLDQIRHRAEKPCAAEVLAAATRRRPCGRDRPTAHRCGRAARPPGARRRARRPAARRRVRRRAAARPRCGRGARRARPRLHRAHRRGSAPSRTRPWPAARGCRGLLDAVGQPRDGLVDRLHAGAHGVDLAGQPGQPFAAVGLGAHRRQVRAFGLGGDALALGQLVAGRVSRVAGLGQLGEQLLARARRPRRPRRPARRGRRPLDVSGSVSRCWARSLAMRTVALTRSASADNRNQLCWAASARSLSPATADLVRVEFDGGGLQPGGHLVVLAAQRRLGLVGVVELGLCG